MIRSSMSRTKLYYLCVLLFLMIIITFYHSVTPHFKSNSILPRDVFDSILFDVTTVYIIVGGGPGSLAEKGYPQWTKLRTIAAIDLYNSENDYEKHKSIFLALSAGSMNGPNSHGGNGRIVFECQHILNHLQELGIPKQQMFGDFISWDTIGNGLTVRMFVDGLLSLQNNFDNKKPIKLQLRVFTSDFHEERVRAVLKWVLSLYPSLSNQVSFVIYVQDSSKLFLASPSDEPSLLDRDIINKSVQHHDALTGDSRRQFSEAKVQSDFLARVEHETRSVQQISRLSTWIRTIPQLQAYLLLGGHKGYSNYLRSEYRPRSQGIG